MSETTHEGDEVHETKPGGGPHGAAPDAGGHADAGHGGHAADAPLGPVDWAAWSAGLLGIAAGLAVAFCLLISTST